MLTVCSTRDAAIRLSFGDSLLAGLPPGGGLYQPCPAPELSDVIAGLPDEAPFVELAGAMTEALLADELGAGAATGAATRGSMPMQPAAAADVVMALDRRTRPPARWPRRPIPLLRR